jgi:hypothetical protein
MIQLLVISKTPKGKMLTVRRVEFANYAALKKAVKEAKKQERKY